jgi:hypothetical protein
MIKSAPEVMDSIASDQGQFDRGFPDAAQIVDQLSRLRIALGSNFIGVGVEKSSELNIQVTDMLFGPCDFKPYSVD